MTRRYSKKRNRRSLSEINVVPYIDVMLVLLVIFMITTPLLTQGVDVKLPEAKTKAIQSNNETPLIITVDKKGLYYLNTSATPSVPMTPQQLSIKVAASLQLAESAHKSKDVYVKGDEGVDYGKVITVMALLQEAGATNIGLMTQPIHEHA
jgi:biopolymer transport protein TolR